MQDVMLQGPGREGGNGSRCQEECAGSTGKAGSACPGEGFYYFVGDPDNITNIESERDDITTDSTDIKRKIGNSMDSFTPVNSAT